MFYKQNKTFWYQFCNFKHFLKAENSEDSFGQFVCSASDRVDMYLSFREVLLDLIETLYRENVSFRDRDLKR